MPKLEFFFDCSSPWTYLAFVGIRPIVERHKLTIDWRPILVGGVFNVVNKDLYAGREAMFNNPRRLTYFMKDLQNWARYRNITINWPDFHPVNSVKAMRGCFVADQHGVLIDYMEAVFRAYWEANDDISSDSVLGRIARECDMDSRDFLDKITQQTYKDALRANTDELIDRGAYGSPTLFIDGDDMYFGNDRLPLVEARLANHSG